MINGYRPAECCIACIFNVYAGRGSRPDIIGRAAGSTSWVMDPNNKNILAPGVAVGEFVAQGATSARAYLQNLEQTEQVFVFPTRLSKVLRLVYIKLAT